MTPRLIVIAGATATGKTRAALALAHRVGGELIGADSVQVYRRLDIGSAKPTRAELGAIEHHLIDLLDLDAHYDASRYVADATEAISRVRARGRAPIVVGGTGLYLRALLYGLAPDIPSDATLRASLNERAAEGEASLRAMHAELSRVDPEYAARIAATDPIRVVRALEVFELTGVPYSTHHQRHQEMPPRFEARLYVLDAERGVLRERISRRARDMLERGWIDEVRAILDDGYAPTLKPLRAVGYAQVVAALVGEASLRALPEAIATATAQFAKRQRNWFRSERGARWIAPDALEAPAALDALKKFIDGE